MKKIITHDGKFHTDEVMSIAIMTLTFPGCGSKVVRTRKVTYEDMTDPEVYVIDVGDDFNPQLNNYDHHQNRGPIRSNDIPYSSAGLIWEEFGRQLVLDERTWVLVDAKIQQIDAADNGYIKDLTENSLQSIVNSFNTAWNESKDVEHSMFCGAVQFMTTILSRWIIQAQAKVDAEDLVNKAIDEAVGEIYFELPKPMPWHDAFFTKERNKKFVIFQSGPEDWRVQCIPPSMEESFKQRCPLAENWAGLRNEELEMTSRIPGANFVHKGRFIGGAKTREAAIKMAEMSALGTT